MYQNKRNRIIQMLLVSATLLLSLTLLVKADPQRQWSSAVQTTSIVDSTNTYPSTQSGAERRLRINQDGSINTVALGAGTTVSGSISVSNFPSTYDMSATQQGLLQRPTVHIDAPVGVSNFPSEYPLSASQEGLLSRPTVHIDAPVVLDSTQADLLARPTVHMDTPVSIGNLPVVVSTWTSYKITNATSNTLTIPFNLVYFDVVADGGSGKLDSNFGAGMFLIDGVGRGSPAFGDSITSPVINLSSLSQFATYYVDVYGK